MLTNHTPFHAATPPVAPIIPELFSMLNEPKTVPIILKVCQHNWEKPTLQCIYCACVVAVGLSRESHTPLFDRLTLAMAVVVSRAGDSADRLTTPRKAGNTDT